MRIKLLKDIREGSSVKAVMRRGRRAVLFTEGAVIEVSDSTGKKYIDRKLAEETEELSPSTLSDEAKALDQLTQDEQDRLEWGEYSSATEALAARKEKS